MTARVHPTAVVAAGARLGADVEIGPLCVVGDGVTIGEGTRLIAAVTILGPTVIGARNVFHPYAVIGGEPQDRSHAGEATRLAIGDENVFREHVTVNRGTAKDRGETRLGSRSWLLAGCHVAHDCVIGDGVTLANAVLLGGHVRVGDHAVIGGGSALQPFVRVGAIAFLAGGSMVERDVPPFVIAGGDRARVRGPNRVGLARRGVPEESRKRLKKAIGALVRGGARALLELPRDDAYVAALAAFCEDMAQS